MKPFYWIDSFEGYPPEMDEPIRESIVTYDTHYGPYTRALGYDFRLMRLEDLEIAVGQRPMIIHAEFGDLLAQPGGAYVGLIHPDRQKAGKLETLYGLIADSCQVKLLNFVPGFPMVCKDKFRGAGIAASVGLNVPRSVLLESGRLQQSQMHFVERSLGPYPFFVRPPDLTSGLGKKVLNDRTALLKYSGRPPFPGRMLLIQTCIAVEAEYRVYLDRGKTIACRLRRPLKAGESCSVPAAVRAGSEALAAHLGASYLCVDWLWDGEQFWFCEFETGGGFGELSEADQHRVAAAFFQILGS